MKNCAWAQKENGVKESEHKMKGKTKRVRMCRAGAYSGGHSKESGTYLLQYTIQNESHPHQQHIFSWSVSFACTLCRYNFCAFSLLSFLQLRCIALCISMFQFSSAFNVFIFPQIGTFLCALSSCGKKIAWANKVIHRKLAMCLWIWCYN